MDARKVVGSRFMKKEDLDGEEVFTILDFSQEEVEDEKTKETEQIGALQFEETKKMLRLNITNMNRIADLFDTYETDDWVGHQIILYPDPSVEMMGQRVGGIRVKTELPAARKKTTNKTTAKKRPTTNRRKR